MEQWCNTLTLRPEKSGGQGSMSGRAPSIEHHDKGSGTRFATSATPAENCNFPFISS